MFILEWFVEGTKKKIKLSLHCTNDAIKRRSNV